MYGKDAYPVVVADTDAGTKVPVIAVAHLGKGRIVCCAHGGYLSAGTISQDQTGELISNLMLWSAELTPQQARQLRIGVVGEPKLVDKLRTSGLSVKALSGGAVEQYAAGPERHSGSPSCPEAK